MKLWLDLLIASDEFIDNARPKYLLVPGSKEPLEYDRLYYRLRAAFEFNGAQHYRTTKQFSDAEAVTETMKRDLMKKALSSDNNIELVTVTAADLTYERMLKKIPKGLPLSGITKDDPRVVLLERLSREYGRMNRG